MLRIWASTALVVANAFAGTLAWSAESVWKLERDREGIQIHSRAVEGWDFREFRGKTQLNARLSSVVAVIDDVNANLELVDVVSASSVHARESDTRYQVYSTMDMPFPMTDRDILNQREIRQDPKTLVVTITDVATKGVMPHKKGLVRLERSRQSWLLTPAPGGVVNIELLILSDPAGPIPASLVNTMSVDTPFDMLVRLKKIVKREQYVQANLSFISEEVAKPKPPAPEAVKAEPVKVEPVKPAKPAATKSNAPVSNAAPKPEAAKPGDAEPSAAPEPVGDKPCKKDRKETVEE